MPTGRIRMGRTSTGGDMGLFASLCRKPGAERAACWNICGVGRMLIYLVVVVCG